MSAYNVNSLLVIHFTTTSGVLKISNEIPLQKLSLRQYGIHFSTGGNHDGLLLFDIVPFTSATINTNVNVTGAIPLICEVQGKDTVESVEFEIDLDRSLTREFSFRLLKPNGDFPTDFESGTLIFNYDNGVMY